VKFSDGEGEREVMDVHYNTLPQMILNKLPIPCTLSHSSSVVLAVDFSGLSRLIAESVGWEISPVTMGDATEG
jgi:hypothetical protein